MTGFWSIGMMVFSDILGVISHESMPADRLNVRLWLLADSLSGSEILPIYPQIGPCRIEPYGIFAVGVILLLESSKFAIMPPFKGVRILAKILSPKEAVPSGVKP